jgi:hypothetical protein
MLRLLCAVADTQLGFPPVARGCRHFPQDGRSHMVRARCSSGLRYGYDVKLGMNAYPERRMPDFFPKCSCRWVQSRHLDGIRHLSRIFCEQNCASRPGTLMQGFFNDVLLPAR